jgi:hypothetical protein
MIKKAFSLFVAVGLALGGVTVGAQTPNSISGTVPQGAKNAANAILMDSAGNNLSMMPIAEGRFGFRDLAPGKYVVALFTASGQQIERSCPLDLTSGSALQTSWDCQPVAGFISTTGWILMGAAAAGITTAVVIATDDDEGPASPIR